VKLYKGIIRIFSNHMASMEVGLALMEDKMKDQVARLDLQHMFVLCGNSALCTHIPNLAVFAHQGLRMEVASRKHPEGPTDTTRQESMMSFLQMWASMSLQEKMGQVLYEICQNRREMVFFWLEAITRADNPYSLLQVFERGHMIARIGSMAYVMRCNPVEVLPRISGNCTEEVPVMWRNITFFVYPISNINPLVQRYSTAKVEHC
jgi:hypothetical protein